MKVDLNLNGCPTEWDIAPGATLLEAIRQAGIESIPADCEPDDCGSCTVLLDGQPVCSCLVPALRASGCSLTTREGLEGDNLLQEIQKALEESPATPATDVAAGVILALYVHLREGGALNEETIRAARSGRL